MCVRPKQRQRDRQKAKKCSAQPCSGTEFFSDGTNKMRMKVTD